MKVKKPLDYTVLKKDFIFVNLSVAIVLFVTFSAMVLQRIGLFPSMVCVVHDVFHIYCLGCGGTRAIFSLLGGDVLASLYYNPAVVLGAALAMYYEVGVLLTLKKKNGKRYYSTSLVPLILYFVIVVVFSIVRNYLLIGCGYDMLQDFIPR